MGRRVARRQQCCAGTHAPCVYRANFSIVACCFRGESYSGFAPFSQRRKVKDFLSPSYFLGQCSRFVVFRVRKTTLEAIILGRLGETSQIVLIPFDVIDVYITVVYINFVLNINRKKPPKFNV